MPRGGLEPPRREALTPEASVSTNSTTEASVVRILQYDFYLSATLVPRGGLEPPRREALTPEASVSTNSTTEAYAADAVHIMRRTHLRQPDFAKNPTFLY